MYFNHISVCIESLQTVMCLFPANTHIHISAVGTRYISISAYQASRDDELSFVRGAVVKVLKKFVDGWWLVRSVQETSS